MGRVGAALFAPALAAAGLPPLAGLGPAAATCWRGDKGTVRGPGRGRRRAWPRADTGGDRCGEGAAPRCPLAGPRGRAPGGKRRRPGVWLAVLGLNGERVPFGGLIITTAAYARPGVFHRLYVSRRRAKPAPDASLSNNRQRWFPCAVLALCRGLEWEVARL